MIGEIKLYNGKNYIKEGPTSGCSSCTFNDKEDGCKAFNSGMDDACYNDQSVWKEYIEKYTVEEVIDCLVTAGWFNSSEGKVAIKSVNKRIKIMTDPEYKTFLKLKEKFKDIL